MFIKEPEPFASFRGELLFEYAQEEVADLVFEIELEGEDESYEVKKLYDVSDATINVASVVANRFMTSPSSGNTSLETPESGYGRVKLKCGEMESSAQYFVASQLELPEVGVMSTVPQERLISYGEADEILIRADEGTTVEVAVECEDEGGAISTFYEHTAEECGLVRFRFATEDFGAYTKRAKVSIACNDEVVECINYCYIPKVKGAVRVAWIGEYGGVEHYTFVATNTLTKYKSGVRRYEIESVYEPQSMVETLAEILTSDRVWIVEDGLYVEVDVVDDELVVNRRGVLSTVVYKIERYD